MVESVHLPAVVNGELVESQFDRFTLGNARLRTSLLLSFTNSFAMRLWPEL